MKTEKKQKPTFILSRKLHGPTQPDYLYLYLAGTGGGDVCIHESRLCLAPGDILLFSGALALKTEDSASDSRTDSRLLGFLSERADEHIGPLLFEQNAVRHAIHPVKGGFSTSVYDPEYLPTDKDIYVEYQDLERAKELMLKEREEQSQEKPSEENDMPRGKRMLIQSLSVIAFMAIVILVVLGSDFIANLLKALFTK